MNLWSAFILWSEKQSRTVIIILGCLMVIAAGALDFLSGPFRSFVFYLIPVFYATWYARRRAGIIISILSVPVWFFNDTIISPAAPHMLVPYWNLAMSSGFLLFVSFLVDRMKSILLQEREAANTDYLTNVANSRYFSEVMQKEIDRSRRYNHILTLAYIDIDNFKEVNDRSGHSAGDALLMTIASRIKDNMRTVDVLARLGGDEFAILFPETDAQGAKIVIDRIRQNIDKTAHGRDWPITISVGVVTCPKVPVSMDKLVMLADETMYMSKQSGKDKVTYRVYAT
ncbi:MAG: diguanylate cyclase [Candidatus Omnitrophota bacterium]